jgi:hypothetical protein
MPGRRTCRRPRRPPHTGAPGGATKGAGPTPGARTVARQESRDPEVVGVRLNKRRAGIPGPLDDFRPEVIGQNEVEVAAALESRYGNWPPLPQPELPGLGPIVGEKEARRLRLARQIAPTRRPPGDLPAASPDPAAAASPGRRPVRSHISGARGYAQEIELAAQLVRAGGQPSRPPGSTRSGNDGNQPGTTGIPPRRPARRTVRATTAPLRRYLLTSGNGGVPLFQELPGHDRELDLVDPLVDLGDLGVDAWPDTRPSTIRPGAARSTLIVPGPRQATRPGGVIACRTAAGKRVGHARLPRNRARRNHQTASPGGCPQRNSSALAATGRL